MRRWAIAAMLFLAACGPGVAGDPYTQAGQAQGAIQATAQARLDAQMHGQQTSQAAQVQAQQTARAQQVEQTAEAAQATYAAGDAIATAVSASARTTQVAANLIELQAVYTATLMAQQAQVLATRQAEASQFEASTNDRDWWFGLVFKAMLAVLMLIGIVFVGVVLWRVSGFLGKLSESRLRQDDVRQTRDGRLVDFHGGRLVIIDARHPILVPGIRQLQEVPALTDTPAGDEPRDLLTMLERAMDVAGEQATKFPTRFEFRNGEGRPMSGSTWDRLVNELKTRGFLETNTQGTFVTGGRTLHDIYMLVD